ncbi:hypothetical protein Hanom_Chr11g01032841 [Helianthus anomalus]
MLGSGVIISSTVLLAGSGRKLGLQPISGYSNAFPMNQTVARIYASKLQVLSFMFVPNCRRCPLSLNLTSFVLNVSKSYTLCPLDQT